VYRLCSKGITVQDGGRRQIDECQSDYNGHGAGVRDPMDEG
jgi:hypothetical protein